MTFIMKFESPNRNHYYTNVHQSTSFYRNYLETISITKPSDTSIFFQNVWHADTKYIIYAITISPSDTRPGPTVSRPPGSWWLRLVEMFLFFDIGSVPKLVVLVIRPRLRSGEFSKFGMVARSPARIVDAGSDRFV